MNEQPPTPHSHPALSPEESAKKILGIKLPDGRTYADLWGPELSEFMRQRVIAVVESWNVKAPN